MSFITIQQVSAEDLSQPYPMHIKKHNEVAQQDFWKGDPASLMGFQDLKDVQRVSLFADDFQLAPERAIGKFPVFVRADGSLYASQLAVASVHRSELDME